MELTPLRYFRAIAQAGHMTRAARTLGVSQPALSAMLKKLEAEVGADLVHRTGRGVELTEAGRVFLGHAEDAIRRADSGVQAVRQLMGLERGSIRVGGGATATSYLLPPVVSAVRKAHPGLHFFIREAGSNAVAAAVQSGELDIGIVTLPLGHAEADGLASIPFAEDELRLITPPPRGRGLGGGRSGRAQAAGPAPDPVPAFDRLASQQTFRWKDLHGVPIVAFEAGTAVRELIDRASAAAGVALSVVMELRSIESIKRMVAEGIGVGFISKFALDRAPGLACRDGKLSRTLAIVRANNRAPSAAVREFEKSLLNTAAIAERVLGSTSK